MLTRCNVLLVCERDVCVKHDRCAEAVRQVSDVANHINDHIKQQDNFIRMLAIQKSLACPAGPCILVPGRVFIKEGQLKKVCNIIFYHIWAKIMPLLPFREWMFDMVEYSDRNLCITYTLCLIPSLVLSCCRDCLARSAPFTNIQTYLLTYFWFLFTWPVFPVITAMLYQWRGDEFALVDILKHPVV